MKTLSEAAATVKYDKEFWNRNRSMAEEISTNPEILQLLLCISGSNEVAAMKLMQAIVMGISIGMEMEKQ